MKLLTVSLFVMISTLGYGQFRLKRLLVDLSNNQDSINIIEYEKKLDGIPRPRQEKNDFLREFCKARLSVKYNALNYTISQTRGTVSLSNLQFRAKRMLERWGNDISTKDTLFINRKYPFVIKTIRGWYNTIQEEIERRKEPEIVKPDMDSIRQVINQLEDSLLKAKYKKEYFNSDRLKSISEEFSDFMSEIKETDSGGNDLTYRIIYERAGPGGTDLVITIEPNFENHQKYFGRGVYEYYPINSIFEFFAIGVRDKIEDSIVIEAWVTGEADGYPLTKKNSSIRYQNMSDLWGTISATIHSGKSFDLSPNEAINNEELAFLRAWNAKYIFEKIIRKECVTRITAIDYSAINPSKKDIKGTYRNATIKVFLLDYFFSNYENLIDRPEENFHDKVIHDESE